MRIVVLLRLVPDLVEAPAILPDGSGLDLAATRLTLNELDGHALEQAILLKERTAAEVTAIAPGMSGAEDALYAAAAGGADRLLQLTGPPAVWLNSHALARAFAVPIRPLAPDLVLVGVQAYDSVDGAVGPLLADLLGVPYLGYVAGVQTEDGMCLARKEYPGGLAAELRVQLPAVLGIQAAEAAPRYVAISRIRQAMRTAKIETVPFGEVDESGGPRVSRLTLPETGERARLLQGDSHEVARQILDLFRERGVL